jgi:hypothetical protein
MIPNNDDVELAIQVLELEEKEVIRAFYAKERAIEARKRPWRLAGAIIRWSLVIVGFGVLLYVFAVLWMAL